VECELRRVDGRRRPASDADVSRWACIRARRRRRLRVLDAATGTLVWRRNILPTTASRPELGHVGVTAHRR
jgi:hypothetical protein